MIPAYWSPTRKLMLLGAMAGGKAVEVQATGNPLTFLTDLSKPLKSLLIPFTPQQEGSGDPSPENIRSILPWDGLNVFHAGANLYKVDAISKTENGVTWTVNADGTVSVDGVAEGHTDINLGRTAVPKKATLIMSGLAESENVVYSDFYFYDANGNIVTILSGRGLKTDTVIDLSQYPTVAKIAVTVKRSSNVKTSGIIKPMLQVGTLASEFEPYQIPSVYPVSFTSPVYGGTLDVVSGVLTVEWVIFDLSNFTWDNYSANRVRSDDLINEPLVFPEINKDKPEVVAEKYIPLQQSGSLADNHNGLIIVPHSASSTGRVLMYFDGENYPSGKACFKLATPQEVQLTSTQITALIGNNTIWSDADGSMTAVYLKKG